MILFSVEKKIAVDKIIWEGLSSSEIHTALHVVQLALLMKAKIFNDISQVCVSLIHLNFLYFFPYIAGKWEGLSLKKRLEKWKKAKPLLSINTMTNSERANYLIISLLFRLWACSYSFFSSVSQKKNQENIAWMLMLYILTIS